MANDDTVLVVPVKGIRLEIMKEIAAVENRLRQEIANAISRHECSGAHGNK